MMRHMDDAAALEEIKVNEDGEMAGDVSSQGQAGRAQTRISDYDQKVINSPEPSKRTEKLTRYSLD